MSAAAAADPVALASDSAASGYVRRQALRDLLGKRDPQAAALCGRLLRDPDRFLRREAAKGLAALGGRAAAVALAAVVTDEDEDVRRAALQGLRAAKDPGFRDAIATLAKDKSFFLRREAEAALRELPGDVSPESRVPSSEYRVPRTASAEAPARAVLPEPPASSLSSTPPSRPPPWKAGSGDAKAEAPPAEPTHALAQAKPAK